MQARAITRMVSVVDRLLLLATIRRKADGRIALLPPPGGFIVSTLDLDDAMRLLGGSRPRLMLAATAALVLSVAVLVAAAVLLVFGLSAA
jgi:hypothetical protein